MEYGLGQVCSVAGISCPSRGRRQCVIRMRARLGVVPQGSNTRVDVVSAAPAGLFMELVDECESTALEAGGPLHEMLLCQKPRRRRWADGVLSLSETCTARLL
jgi:hypothetical protein